MNPMDHSTDKILITVILIAVLIAAAYTKDPTIADAFKVSLGAAIAALAQRITVSKE